MLPKILFSLLLFTFSSHGMDEKKNLSVLENLPKQVTRYILTFCDVKTVGRVACTNKKINAILKKELGQKLYFPHHKKDDIRSYVELFKFTQMIHEEVHPCHVYEKLSQTYEWIKKIYTQNKADEVALLLFTCHQSDALHKFYYTRHFGDFLKKLGNNIGSFGKGIGWGIKEGVKKLTNKILPQDHQLAFTPFTRVPDPKFIQEYANKAVDFYINLGEFGDVFWVHLTNAAEVKTDIFKKCTEEKRQEFLKTPKKITIHEFIKALPQEKQNKIAQDFIDRVPSVLKNLEEAGNKQPEMKPQLQDIISLFSTLMEKVNENPSFPNPLPIPEEKLRELPFWSEYAPYHFPSESKINEYREKVKFEHTHEEISQAQVIFFMREKIEKDIQWDTLNDPCLWYLTSAARNAISIKNQDNASYTIRNSRCRAPNNCREHPWFVLAGFTQSTAEEFFQKNESHPVIKLQKWFLKQEGLTGHDQSGAMRLFLIKILLGL